MHKSIELKWHIAGLFLLLDSLIFVFFNQMLSCFLVMVVIIYVLVLI